MGFDRDLAGRVVGNLGGHRVGAGLPLARVWHKMLTMVNKNLSLCLFDRIFSRFFRIQTLYPDSFGGGTAEGDGPHWSFDGDGLVVVFGEEADAGVGTDAGLVEEDEQLWIAF